MSRAAERLAEILETRGPAPGRERTVRALQSDYVPWWAQRMMHRADTYTRERGTPATFRVVVAGRQGGKTRCAAEELLRVMTGKPGSYSILLAPTYQIARTAVRTVLAAATAYGLPFEWREQKKELQLPNGSMWAVFSADRKESVRGPTINGLFWVDEGAYLSERAWEAALGALVAVAEPQVLITTTPAGKNWVWTEWCSPDNRAVRFRSEDSPYSNKAFISRARRKMSREKAAQEFDAVFVDALLLAFPDREHLWVDSLPPHTGDLDNVLGVDLGKEQDYVVVTLANKHGEFTPLGRWRRVEWPTTVDRIAGYCKRFAAIPVLDQGFGYGSTCADYLRRDHKIEALLVNTGSRRQKGEIVEAARADVQYARVRMLKAMTPTDAPHNDDRTTAPLWEVYDHEMGRFQMHTKAAEGEDVTTYRGPDLPGEHDDCPISFCLANWGRLNAWESTWRSPAVDLKGFVLASKSAGHTVFRR